ncbi:TetR/AcrR family transcriptional regulator [Nitriliruptor alkaliphilus]|uniref:TetR/AcrR family transcriptional regulator n=1 Tax=Nitriliruptor alkaliphilus TaxID=427918 RepID=UPI000696E1DA|nr:TetR/AcrR family transcriptional regulator [Nitriliruptor alkaliphilus]
MPDPDAPLERGDGRARILEAAAEVFAERGYDGARVQEIARRAGMTTGAIYAHFAGRHDLLLAATDLHARTDAQQQLDALGDVPAIAILAAIAPQLATDPQLGMRPMALEALVAGRRDGALGAIMRTKVESSNAELVGLVTRGQREGSIAGDLDPGTVAKFLNALLVGVAALAPVWEEDLDEDAWSTLVGRVLAALGPIEPPSSA